MKPALELDARERSVLLYLEDQMFRYGGFATGAALERADRALLARWVAEGELEMGPLPGKHPSSFWFLLSDQAWETAREARRLAAEESVDYWWTQAEWTLTQLREYRDARIAKAAELAAAPRGGCPICGGNSFTCTHSRGT